MTSTGARPLVFYDGRGNARSYVQLIGDILLAFINSKFSTNPGSFWCMQDSVRPHVSGFAKNSLKEKCFSRMAAFLLRSQSYWESVRHDRPSVSNYTSKELDGGQTND
ncbi:unnamed protein product [Rotaria socialis]|uniref:Transposase n=2 Tax=Rotaria socialis TaxID=392032 RepID=A0A820KVB4_9BILA|nr:unnamed protein product [Rotaria socialis]CAF3192249.1 unnamed protein product [Rotaria socialis]CAF3320252.1 unnamed protein product [Rotaria socialis]CAF3483682.1 unnamed protein product [Rotaria socialis]CAF4342851.1 unnamed protein product [Rotaria socialis]